MGTVGTVGTNLAQRWIYIKIGNKTQFLPVKHPKNDCFCGKKKGYF
jgi:hypothetical protein